MQICPFCGAPETDRIHVDGGDYIVFRCMFTPRVQVGGSEVEIAESLRRDFGTDGKGYFRRSCDRLHYYVTKGPTARELGGGTSEK